MTYKISEIEALANDIVSKFLNSKDYTRLVNKYKKLIKSLYIELLRDKCNSDEIDAILAVKNKPCRNIGLKLSEFDKMNLSSCGQFTADFDDYFYKLKHNANTFCIKFLIKHKLLCVLMDDLEKDINDKKKLLEKEFLIKKSLLDASKRKIIKEIEEKFWKLTDWQKPENLDKVSKEQLEQIKEILDK